MQKSFFSWEWCEIHKRQPLAGCLACLLVDRHCDTKIYINVSGIYEVILTLHYTFVVNYRYIYIYRVIDWHIK